MHLGDDRYRHVLVKFTETANTPAKRRWVDLLICEHLAARVLADQGIAAAASELVVAGERLCLEVARFDRIGAHGRRGASPWPHSTTPSTTRTTTGPTPPRASPATAGSTPSTLATIRWLHTFGQLIANTDLHFGNLSFHLHSRPPARAGARLRHAADALPPRRHRRNRRARIPAAVAHAGSARVLATRRTLAITFWRAVEADARVSLPFRRIATANAALIQKARDAA